MCIRDRASNGSNITDQSGAQADVRDPLAGDDNEGRLATVGLPINDVDIVEPALTIQQQQEQVKVAKERAEAAARQSQEKLEQIETSLAPDPLERESLAKVEVGYAIEQWRSSWETGDVQAYLRKYDPSFKPANGLSIDEWESQRVTRVTPSKKIKLSLSAFEMSFSENFAKAQVEFQQAYSAGAYSETSTKQLVLLKVAGNWKIVSEIEVE